MKPTQQQKQWLKDYLYQVMNYRETCEEVYDHILTALEDKPEQKYFESAVNEVIVCEFGGHNGLLEMEENCRKAGVEDIVKAYRSYFYEFFKFPGIIFTLMILLIQHFYFSRHVVMPFVWIGLIFLQVALFTARKMVNRYKFKNTKTSFKDKFLARAIYKPVCYLYLFNLVRAMIFSFAYTIFHHKLNANLILVNHIFSLIANTIFIVHSIAYFRLYKDDFNNNPYPVND
jgi:hypothetical protein